MEFFNRHKQAFFISFCLLSLILVSFFSFKEYQKDQSLKWPEDPEKICSFIDEKIKDSERDLKTFFVLKKVQKCNSFHIPKQIPSWLEYEKNLSLLKIETKKNRRFDYYKRLSELEIDKEKKIKWMLEALKIQKDKKIQKKIYQIAPRLNPYPKKKDYYRVAKDFYHHLNFKKSDLFYQKIISQKFSFYLKLKAYSGLYKNKKVSGQKKQAEKILKRKMSYIKNYYKIYPHRRNQKVYYKNLYKLARHHWNQDENKKAYRLLKRLISSSKFYQAKALYIKGMIEKDQNNLNESVLSLSKALDSEFLEERLKEKILWTKAWIFKKLKKYDQAITDLKELNEQFPSERYEYWLAKVYELKGLKKNSLKIYKNLSLKHPYQYYGILSHYHLNKRPTHPKKHYIGLSTSFLSPLSKKTKNSIKLLKSLYELEELKNIEYFLKSLKKKYTHWEKFLIYNESKNFLKAFLSYLRLSDFESFYIQSTRLSSLYPQIYKDQIAFFAKKHKLPFYLIYSLIRQESGFYQKAISPMKAYGLMQILDQKAKQTAKEENIPYHSFKDLFKPDYNIKIGSLILRNLLKKYDQSYILSIAAYNAGEAKVDEWLKEIKALDKIEFIEQIPYSETRLYVKLILRNMFIYHMLSKKSERDFFNKILK